MVNKYFEVFKKKIEDLNNGEWVINSYFNNKNKRFVVEARQPCDTPKRAAPIYINYLVNPENEGAIGQVYVCEPFREKGLGALLMLTALYDLKEQGIDTVSLNTPPENYKMIGLAKKVGFKPQSSSAAMKSLVDKLEDPLERAELTKKLGGSMKLQNLQKMEI